jgi:hypothetical protein
MSTHEHEMFRHALRSAADSIEPRSDGLDQIRAQLRRQPYPLPVAWAAALWMRLTLWLPEGAFSAGKLAYSARRQVADTLRSVSERFRPEPASGRLRSISRWFFSERPEPSSAALRSLSQWFLSDLPEPIAEDTRNGRSSRWSLLRPLAAFGVAVFIVAVGAYVAIEVPAVVSTQSGNTPQPGPGTGGGSNGPGGVAGNSSSRFPSSGPSGSPGRSASSSTSPACLNQLGPTRGPSRSTSPTTTPSRTGSPSPTGSGSPSSSSTPSPTPTATGSSTPTPAASQSAATAAGQPTQGASAGAARTTTAAVILPAKAAASVQTSRSPCAKQRPRKTRKRTTKRANVTATSGLGRSSTPAEPARPGSSSSA